MSTTTRIKFFGVKKAEYAGASRDSCLATDPEASGWHVVVGGTQCSIVGVADFAKHFGDFLQLAYAAGKADAKADLRERLGL